MKKSDEWTKADFSRAKPAKESFTPEQLAMLNELRVAAESGDLVTEQQGKRTRVYRGRGRPKEANPKVNKTLRLSPRLVDAMQRSGKGYSERAEKALMREFMPKH